MKKFFSCLFFVFLLSSPVFAKAIKVSALQPFSTENPSETLKVMALETVEFKNGVVFEDGAIIKGKVIDVKSPKRAKLNASFKFMPIEYTYNGKTTVINKEEFVGKYAPFKEIDKGELAINAASTAGSIFLHVPGFGQAVSFVKGAVKDPDDNRLKSGVKQIYKDSPLSYVEEGKEVVLVQDSVFVLKFKTGKDDEHEMYDGEDEHNTTPDSQPVLKEIKEQVPATMEKSVPQASEPEAVMDEPVLSPHDPETVLKEVEQKTK